MRFTKKSEICSNKTSVLGRGYHYQPKWEVSWYSAAQTMEQPTLNMVQINIIKFYYGDGEGDGRLSNTTTINNQCLQHNIHNITRQQHNKCNSTCHPCHPGRVKYGNYLGANNWPHNTQNNRTNVLANQYLVAL